jgi:hypothetical protein
MKCPPPTTHWQHLISWNGLCTYNCIQKESTSYITSISTNLPIIQLHLAERCYN